MPRSKARRTIARWVSSGRSSPKFCQRPSEIGGQLQAAAPAPAVRHAVVASRRRDIGHGVVSCGHGSIELGRGGAGHDRDGFGHGVRLRRHDRDSPPEPHDVDPVGELEDVRHVVADQDDGQAALADALDQVEHLTGLLDAERGRRLVHDHEPSRPRRRPRDGDALALAAGEGLDRLGDRLDADVELGEVARRLAAHGALVEHAQGTPSGPRRRCSRPRKMFEAMSSAGATARSW